MLCKLNSITNIFGLCVVVTVVSAEQDCNWTDLATGTHLVDHVTGVSWGDVDGDGDDDLVIATEDGGPTYMFLNDGAGGFVQHSDPWLDAFHDVKSLSLGDFDNDGDLDLLSIGFSERCYLLENQDMTFVEINIELMLSLGNAANTPGRISARGGAWVDYDADGLLDIYLSTNALANSVGGDKLLRNYGNGIFANVSPDVFTEPDIGRGLVWSDFDNDGDVDLYAAAGTGCPCYWNEVPDGVSPGEQDWYQRASNNMYSNEGGVFTDETNGVTIDIDNARGVTAGDYDNDGDIDIFICNLEVTGQEGSNPESFGGFNKLLKNLLIDNGVLNPMNAFLFEDVTPEALRPVGGQRACGWLDADNDGDLDLLLVPYDGTATTILFENINNGESFVPMCEEVFGDPLYDTFNGQGCAFSDFDKDGDVDIFITFKHHEDGQFNRFLRNDLANGNHWFEIKLVGTQSNIGGIGARVKLTYTDSNDTELEQIRDVRTGTSYWSQNSLVQHFGLGGGCPTDIDGNGQTDVTDLLVIIGEWGQSDSAADINGDGIVDVLDLLAVIDVWGPCPDDPEVTKVEVTWPSGIHQVIEKDLTIDTLREIVEPMGARRLARPIPLGK